MRDPAKPLCNDFAGMNDFLAEKGRKIVHTRNFIAFFR